jgi:hypothetical protein
MPWTSFLGNFLIAFSPAIVIFLGYLSSRPALTLLALAQYVGLSDTHFDELL